MGKNRARWRQYSKEQLQKMADESRSSMEFREKLGYKDRDCQRAWKIVKEMNLVVDHWQKQEPALWRRYSADELRQMALDSTYEMEFLRKIGYPSGNGHSAMTRIRSEIGIDTSHWVKYSQNHEGAFPNAAGELVVKDKTYTKEELQTICNECRSYRQFAIKLGFTENRIVGKTGKKIVVRFHLDCEHFVGQGWNKDNFDLERFRDYTDDPENKPRTRSFYDALDRMRGHRCENPECGASEHCGKPIPLEIHHKDGNRFNNTLENLELLCPTCHAMTDNFRGRNTVPEEQVTDEEFAKALKSSSNIKEAIDKVGCTIQGSMYNRARRLIDEYDIEHLKVRDEMYNLVRNQDKIQNKAYKNDRGHIFELINLCLIYPTNQNKEKLEKALNDFIEKYSKDDDVKKTIKLR